MNTNERDEMVTEIATKWKGTIGKLVNEEIKKMLREMQGEQEEFSIGEILAVLAEVYTYLGFVGIKGAAHTIGIIAAETEKLDDPEQTVSGLFAIREMLQVIRKKSEESIDEGFSKGQQSIHQQAETLAELRKLAEKLEL